MIEEKNIVRTFIRSHFRKDRNAQENTKYLQIKCLCGISMEIQYGQRKTHSGKCRSCSRKGRPAWNKGISNVKVSGPNSPNWKGGTYISFDGYRQILVGIGKKYKREHTIIMEKSLNRLLVKGECVHHVDGQKLNNELENLIVCTN